MSGFRSSSSAVRVGQYIVKGNAEYAVVIEKRFNKDYILEEFKGTKNDETAFDRATQWARTGWGIGKQVNGQ